MNSILPAAVVQLKTITSALPADEGLTNTMVENAGVLQQILIHVVSIICNFIDFHSSKAENVLIKSTGEEVPAGRSKETYKDTSAAVKSSVSETILSWHQTTVVSVMEAGGLNWLLGKVCRFSFIYDNILSIVLTIMQLYLYVSSIFIPIS